MTGIKLLTCCYCGTRDAMRMGKGQRRSLTCRSCGATVRKMEAVHSDGEAYAPARPRAPAPKREPLHKPPPPHKRKRKKSGFALLLDRAEDLLDLDDLFDFD